MNSSNAPAESKRPDPAPTSDNPTRYIRSGALTLDSFTRRVSIAERDVSLPPSTFDFLTTLVRHSPNPVSYEQLVRESQGYSLGRAEAREMARWQIHEIRKAIETDAAHPRYIITVRDVGYRLIS